MERKSFSKYLFYALFFTKCFLYGPRTFLRFLSNFNNPQLLYMNKNIFKTTSEKQNISTDKKISKEI